MEEKQKPSLIERRLYARILQIMEDKKPYLDPQFNLCQLANLACTNRTRLSSTLNNQTGMNFSRWLANYRVKHLIRGSPNVSHRNLRSYTRKQVLPPVPLFIASLRR